MPILLLFYQILYHPVQYIYDLTDFSILTLILKMLELFIFSRKNSLTLFYYVSFDNLALHMTVSFFSALSVNLMI